MLDAARPGNVRNVNQPINAVFDFNKCSEVGEVANLAVNAVADLISFAESAPGIVLHLLHAEADAARFRIHAEHFNFDRITGADQFAGMLHAFGPAHLRHVNQTFDAGFKFNERAVIGHARDFSIHARVGWKALFDRLPRIRQKLFEAERNALPITIKPQHFHLHRVADLEHLSRILQTTPRHVSHVQQAIDAAEIDKRTVVRQVLDLALDDDVFFNLPECLAFTTRVALFENGLAREHDV